MSNGNGKKPPQQSQQAMNQVNAQNKQRQRNNPSNKKNFKKVVQQARSNDIRSTFLNALINPFDPSSMGCQVPDPFPFPTQTFHVHQTTVIGNSTNATSGCVAFLPSPILSMIDMTRLVTLTPSLSVVTNTPFTQFSTNPGSTAANCMYGAVAPTALSSVFSDFRVVSWGIKISNLQPELSATGRIMIAMVPLGDTIPSYNELGTATLTQTGTPIFGMNVQNLATANLLELPTGFQVTVGDMLHGDLEIAGMYTNANFWTFKTSVTQAQTESGFLNGDSVRASITAGTVQNTGYKDMTRCVGGSAIVIYYEGMPPNTPNNFQVETIYHLEGTPNFSSTANNALISSTARKATVGTSNVVEQVMTQASKMENAVGWIEKGANFLNANKSTIFKIGAAAAAFL